MNAVLVVVNTLKENSLSLLKKVSLTLQNYDFNVIEKQTESENFSLNSVDFSHIKFIISIGGDGTLISVINKVYKYNIPIFAINTGELGFTTPFSVDDWREGLVNFITTGGKITEKTLLEVGVYKKDDDNFTSPLFTTVAHNEVVLYRSSHIMRLDSYIEDKCIAKNLSADGVIVSTPTGSTAYSMSCGGSVISLSTDAFIFTPICPFMAIDRSIVFSSDKSIRININALQKEDTALLNTDGNYCREVSKKDTVLIKKSNYKVYIVANKKLSDISRIAEKMMWIND